MTLNELNDVIKKEKINNGIKKIQISIVEEEEYNQVFNSREVLTATMELDDALKMFGNMQIGSIGTPSLYNAFIKVTLVYDACSTYINVPINKCNNSDLYNRDLLSNSDCINVDILRAEPNSTVATSDL